MGPLRILILAVLIYIGYRLLRNSFRNKGGTSENEETTPPGPNERLTDVLIEDPVCGNLVPREQAVQLEKDGTLYYFCSQECCNKFEAENTTEGE